MSGAQPAEGLPGGALCGVILHPAAHTLSPLLHRTAYEMLGIDAQYASFDVRPDQLGDALTGMRALGIRQLSVSLPHKEAALRLSDRASPQAKTIGAANTLTLVGDELVADNTDAVGVVRTLEPLGAWKGRRATVVGAGGAARAVVFALVSLGLEVSVFNRTAARAERLAKDLGARVGTLAAPYDLLVNATSVGMEPDADASPVPRDVLRPGATVFDIVYRPLETRLLREARAAGCRTQDGLDMLVHQAVEQIRLWTGRTPNAAPLRAAAERALGAR
jgi:shikimate dehydrogenase